MPLEMYPIEFVAELYDKGEPVDAVVDHGKRRILVRGDLSGSDRRNALTRAHCQIIRDRVRHKLRMLERRMFDRKRSA